MAMQLQRAIEGFELHLRANGSSEHTLKDYLLTLARFAAFLGPVTRVDTIGPDDVRRYLEHYASREVAPAGVAARPVRRLSKKTLRNMHTALSSFFSWAVMEGYAEEHPIRNRIARPKANPPPIDPLSDEQMVSLIGACNGSERNKALILFLLDTGARASEVCDLRRADLDLKTRTATVTGKGDKPRLLVFQATAGSALFRYLSTREDDEDTVFLSNAGRALSRSALLRIVMRAGNRAGIRNLYPHRLRHTMAVHYIMNGGDMETLRMALGHSDYEMVRRYLRIAGADQKRIHRLASPVENALKKKV